MDSSDQFIKERLANLPPSIKEAVASAKVDQMVQQIGSTYRLHIDQLDKLYTEMMLVMLGLEPASQFPKNLQRQLSMSEQDAASAAIKINEEIFLPIREALHELYAREAEKEAEAAASEQAFDLEPSTLGGVEKPLPSDVLTAKAPTPTVSDPNKLPTHRPARPAQAINQAEKKPPQPESQDTAAIARQRLGGEQPQLPKEERVIEERSAANPPSRPTYKGVDPYREPPV